MPTPAEPGRPPRRVDALIWLLLATVVALTVGALAIGRFPIGSADVLALLRGEPMRPALATVLLEVRLPRIVAALLVGTALATAGAAYQGLFRNPLVSPDILGVAAGSSLGAVIGIFVSLPVLGIQLLAFAFAILTVAAVTGLAAVVRGHEPILVLILAGIVVGTLAGSIVSLLKILADPYDQLPAITFWLLGSLAGTDRSDVLGTAPLVLLGLVPLWLLRWRLNVLTMSEEEARAVGLDVRRMRLAVIVTATLITAAVTAITGIVGWVGLVVPHMARLLVGPDYTRLLPVAALLGAAFLLLVDTAARTIAPTEVPLGILTSLVGAPLFVWLLASGKRGWS